MDWNIKNSELTQILFKSKNYCSSVISEYLKENYDLDDDMLDALDINLRQYFLKAFNNRFKKSMYNETKFNENNKEWLEESFAIPKCNQIISKNLKPYNEVSPSTKKRRLADIFEQIPVTDLLEACQKRIKKMNSLSDESMVEEEVNDTKDLHGNENISDDEILALFIDAKLTKFQYEVIRNFFINKKIYSLPGYKKVTAAKMRCCPAFDISETGCVTKLQDILNHTAERIVTIPEIERMILEKNVRNLNLVLKYGSDGTSGFTQFKQAFVDSKNLESNSAMIFGIVPLCLNINNRESSDFQFWKNKNPSSTKYCRVIKFAYEKETQENIIQEMNLLKQQIADLKPTKICLKGKTITINHTLLCTMIDGKTRQVLTETESSQRCTVCGVLPKEINDLEIVRKKKLNLESYQYGLSTLHGWIRFMEWILHLAYKLQIKKHYQKLTEAEKEIIKIEKKRIQIEIRDQLGILVDCVKQGAGNTNDGNVARKFFSAYSKVSSITKIREDFIKRIYVIMQTITSKKSIRVQEFKKYCDDTAKIYVDEYKWFPMPPSCHMILIHGSEIIGSFFIPIGQLSEEAQEAKNKDFKRVREYNTRKHSATKTNEDIMRYFQVSSDPYISHLRISYKTKSKEHLAEASDLLIEEEN